MDIVDAQYSGPTFEELSQAANSAGVSIPDNAQSSNSVVSIAYWQQKAADFQSTLNALDTGYYAAQIALNSPELLAQDETLYDDLNQFLADFDSKKTALKVTAEAINSGAAVVNAMGGNFPKLNIPSTLGLPPIGLPVVAIGAFAVAATLITWGVTWLRGLNERLSRAQLFEQLTPDVKAVLAQALAKSDEALKQADSTSFSSIASLVKWGGIAAAAFFAYRAFTAHQKSSSYNDDDD